MKTSPSDDPIKVPSTNGLIRKENPRHRLRAKHWCDALLSTPPEKLEERVSKHRDTYVNRPVVDELLRRVRHAVFVDAGHAKYIAETALFLVEEMVPGISLLGPVSVWYEIKGRCFAYLGNCYRVLCRWDEAAQAFERAEYLRRLGTGDPHVHAELLSFQGSFFKEQRQFGEAIDALEEAAQVHRLLEERQAEGVALLNLAQVYRQARQPSKALPVHIRACELVDEYQDPLIGAAAWNNLIRIYIDLGEFDSAHSVLRGASSVYDRCSPDSSVHLVRHWTEGSVLAGLGRHEEALQHLRIAKEGFSSRHRPFDSALVHLDIMKVALKQGQHSEVERIGSEVYAALLSQPLQREAREALDVLAEAAVQRRLEERLIEEAVRAIQDQPRVPHLVSSRTSTVVGAWDTFPEG